MSRAARFDKVEPGQIWADNDWRAQGRTLRVDAVDEHFAYCKVLTAAPGAFSSVGKSTKIALRRMRPTSTGYRLIVDGDDIR